ncbi:acetylglutamate kinase [Actinobacillus equuli]|uniref:acetylglutamate kinase n=1 Tax=Actinobacillus equuli TaxID=718 RepID=UPI002443033E|nr:acetylglutamate kinase [Actinobacillus equuli]WGE65641.1 acetylglutamate kinase [Actinobacillus equuli subsp. equuli]WGE79592.1 acetylglutamate kinase [Actinobacillus equuli subsp. equuli]WGE85849.1 acetylglutamate kinase [Actinobacillus equuli subsp. haemolyticus]
MLQNEVENFANLLEKATAYLAPFQEKIIVVKYGGNAMINEDLKKLVMQDILLLNQLGVKVVLVHGGGPEISQGVKLLGKEPQFINGLRVTDQDTINVVLQMLAGKVNKSLVALLKGKGVGLCGIDANMLQCEKLQAEVDYGFVGEIVKVNTQLLDLALNANLIPVISTVGVDEQGVAYNINADTAASEIAMALGAAKLVSMTDIAGLLRDRFDESTLIPEVEVGEVQGLIDQGIIAGGMIPKIACCTDFINAGGIEANIIDGRVPHAILVSLFGGKNGTLFYKK